MMSQPDSSRFNGHFEFVYYAVGDEGQLLEEKIYSGNAILTRDRIVSFARMSEGPFGYSGRYEVADQRLRIRVDSCIAPDLEGQTFDWRYEWTSDADCILSGKELSTGRSFRMQVRRTDLK